MTTRTEESAESVSLQAAPHFHRPSGVPADILCQHHFADTAPFLDTPDAWRMCRITDHGTCCVCNWRNS